MASPNHDLPEGTDHIIAGASGTPDDKTAADIATLGGVENEDLTDDDDDFAETTTAGGVSGGSDGGFKPAIALEGDTLREKASSAVGLLREKATEQTGDLRGQATDKVRELAIQGKDRATSALDGVSRLISQAAGEVDDKVGPEYGDYARRAQDMIDSLANTLRDKDVDTLFADARALAQRSPTLAVSTAAVLGFALVRLVRSGLQAGHDTARTEA